ncbi:MAG: methylmalonyl Co-A mutase-associated GTPase MeaB [Deltaproteobacteria bacterium]|nr:methylmalonyl Co-A mutase-associated GTPase MeaB [Deltaproteobacteria bacterium]
MAVRLLARDRDAVPEALNLADDQRPGRREAAIELLDSLERESAFPGAARVGVTGAPGSGKSTLLDAFVRRLRPRGETVAIVAVDPSSRRSGGALLGDRIRVRSGSTDQGVFIRSMAARERLGGLADASRASVAILAAAFDRVFVETVGVGQSEAEVAGLVDSLLYVANPGAGDLLQFLKAGVLELPDVFLVNKADAGPDAQRTAADLESSLGLGEPADAGWSPPVLLASARDGTGIDAVLETLDAHRRHLIESGGLRERRQRGHERCVLDGLARRYGSYGLKQLGGATGVAAIREIEGASAPALIACLGREIEHLCKPAQPARSVQVDFYATLRLVVGRKTVDVSLPEGATVRDLLDTIVRRFPPLAEKLLDEAGRLSSHVNVFIDGRGAPYLENGLDTVLRADQKVDIFPAVAGG